MWMVAVVAIFLGLLLPAVSAAGGDGSTTSAISDLLAPIGGMIGVMFVVVCAGAFLNWFSGGGF
jgi:hypothetical protein